jgi:hypothetical protein
VDPISSGSASLSTPPGKHLLRPTPNFITLLKDRYGLLVRFACQLRLVNLKEQTLQALPSGDES